MKIEDVKITADKPKEQTPELNEDGTPKVPVVDPALEEKDLEEDDVEDEELDEEEVDDEKEEDDEEEIEEAPADPVPPVTPKPEVPPVDYRKKFSESTRRNQIVESKFVELQKVLGDITKQEIPTDQEMTAVDPDWEYRSDYEKNQALKLVVLERRQNLIFNTVGSISKESEFAEKIHTFIESSPDLKGKEEKFYDFATDPKNQGASPEVLLKAFLYEVKDDTTVTPVTTDPKPKVVEKAPRLNTSTPQGGSPKPKKEGAYSDEEIKVIRTTDHKKYNKLVREGKI